MIGALRNRGSRRFRLQRAYGAALPPGARALTIACVAAGLLGGNGWPAHGQAIRPAPAAASMTVHEAVELALRGNRTLAVAKLQTSEAAMGVATARLDLLPRLTVQAGAGYLLDPLSSRFPRGSLGTAAGEPLPSHNIDVPYARGLAAAYSITLAQPLTLLPLAQNGIRIRQIDASIAAEREREQRQLLTSRVRRAYYSILQAEQAVKATNEALRALHELERTVANGVAQQSVLRADLLDVQARVAGEEAILSTQLDGLQGLREQMNMLLGRDVQTPFRAAPLAAAGDPDSDNASNAPPDLRSRPDLRRSALLLRQAAISRGMVRQAFVPDVSLGVVYTGLADRGFGAPDHLLAVGLLVTWQPFSALRQRQDLAQRTLAVREARLLADEARAAAEADFNSQVRLEHQAREQLRATAATLAAARERLRVVTNQFAANTALSRDVLQAQAAAAQAEKQALDAELALRTAGAELRRASGQE